MENASKALIIAGAVLISILIISLGILIYNQAADIVNDNSMNEIQVTSFNQKFLSYEGTRNGSQVKTLLQQVRANNSNEQNTEKQISVNTPASGTTVSDDAKGLTPIDFKVETSKDDPSLGAGFSIPSSKIKNGTSYVVTFDYGDGKDHEAGLIYNVNIYSK